MRSEQTRKSKRTGGTTVEFAVVAPLFFLLVIGAIQLYRFATICNSVETAVFEGARKGILPSTTVAQIQDTVNSSLAANALSGHTVNVERRAAASGGEEVDIQVELSMAANGFLVPSSGNSWNIRRNCTIRCE